MKKYLSALILIIVVVLQGCVSADHTAKPLKLKIPQRFTAAEKRPELSITDNLLSIIKDEEAKKLVDEAVKNNYNLKAAAQRLNSSRLLLARSKSALTPEVTAGYALNRSNQTIDRSTRDNHKVSMSVSWELDLWGKLADIHSSEKAGYEASKADYIHALDSLAARVLQSYFTTKAQKMRIKLQNRKIELLKSIEELIVSNYKSGLGSIDELSSAKTNTEIAESVLIAKKQTYKEYIRELETLMGRYPEGKLEFSSALPDVAMPSQTAPASVLKNRPDILAASKRYEAAIKSSSAAEKAKLPNIVLSADIFRSNEQFNKLGATGSSWGLLGNILYPVFNRGKLESESKAAVSEAEAAYMDMADKVLTAMREVEDAFSREKHLRDQLVHLKKAVKSAEDSSMFYEKRYLEGLEDLLSLQNAREQEIDVKSSLIDIKVQKIINRIDMALAMGVGAYGKEQR